MATLYTVDASVFVSAFQPREPTHQDSRRLLIQQQERGIPVVVPTLLVPEVAAALARGLPDPALGRAFAGQLARLPLVTWVSVDPLLAEQAADLAATYRLRGSDAVYAAVAVRYGATLITLDVQQRDRARLAVATLSPAEALLLLS